MTYFKYFLIISLKMMLVFLSELRLVDGTYSLKKIFMIFNSLLKFHNDWLIKTIKNIWPSWRMKIILKFCTHYLDENTLRISDLHMKSKNRYLKKVCDLLMIQHDIKNPTLLECKMLHRKMDANRNFSDINHSKHLMKVCNYITTK